VRSHASTRRTFCGRHPHPPSNQLAPPRVVGGCPPDFWCGHCFRANVWSRCAHKLKHLQRGRSSIRLNPKHRSTRMTPAPRKTAAVLIVSGATATIYAFLSVLEAAESDLAWENLSFRVLFVFTLVGIPAVIVGVGGLDSEGVGTAAVS